MTVDNPLRSLVDQRSRQISSQKQKIGYNCYKTNAES
jgi:hypothetical protein